MQFANKIYQVLELRPSRASFQTKKVSPSRSISSTLANPKPLGTAAAYLAFEGLHTTALFKASI
jgi:hypothetical protein